ncbi:hypothetical protein C4E44_13740 [Pseudomonas sp. MWU12-2312b]|nr:hypothetical protein C4E44_13740 [Pseudomonas sp. MWU12-2312b]
MRGKLQNFAKAAILAIAQKNCSNDDVSAWPKVGDKESADAGSAGKQCVVGHLQASNCEYVCRMYRIIYPHIQCANSPRLN